MVSSISWVPRSPRKTVALESNHIALSVKQIVVDTKMSLQDEPVAEEKGTISIKPDPFQTSGQHQHQRTTVAELRAFAEQSLENGDVSSAEEVFRYVLRIFSQTPNSPEIEIIETLAGVGRCCKLSGRPEEAMHCYREVLQLKKHQRLQDEPTPVKLVLADIFYDMGLIHSRAYMERENVLQGGSREDLARKAIKSFSFSIELRKRCLGEGHPMIASAQHNIATILVRARHFRKALEYYTISLSSRRKSLGGHHPEVASSLRHIAIVHRAMGNIGEASIFLLEALEILKGVPFESSLREVVIELSHLKRS